MYLALLASGITGMGAGVINPFRGIASLQLVIPAVQKRLALTSIIANSVFVSIAGWSVLFSNLSMEAY